MLLIHPYNINLNQRGNEIDKVKVKWLVLVKIYGKSPRKLLNKINENIEIKIKVDPFEFIFPNNILNSLWSFNKIKFHIIKWRLGINQNENGININPKKVLIQLIGMFNKLVDGSKIENKLVIIFNLNWEFFNF